jgi:hypothetical protein
MYNTVLTASQPGAQPGGGGGPVFRSPKSEFKTKHFIDTVISNVLPYLSFSLTFYWNLLTTKAIPLQAWTGPVCSRRLRLPDCNTVGT